MTEEEIVGVIEAVNAGSAGDHVFAYRLKGNVSLARVWTTNPKTRRIDVQGNDFYLVHDAENGQCIGAVLDMQEDLHAFLKPEFRRKGIMSRSLREIILPHIFSKGRTLQKITFRDERGRLFAEKLGFVITDDTTAQVAATSAGTTDFPKTVHAGLDRACIDTLCERLLDAACSIRKVRDELAIKMGGELSDSLSDLALDVELECTEELGFVIPDDTAAQVAATSAGTTDFPKTVHAGLDRACIDTLCDRLLDAACGIRKVRDELAIKKGEELSDSLSDLAWRVQWKCADVLDYWKRLEHERWLSSRS